MGAGDAGTSAGLTLLEATNARSAALGDAFTAVSNDVSAFSYNPAALSTLSSGQISLLYDRGMSEDSFGHLLIGLPGRRFGWGVSVGYYNGGTFELTSQEGSFAVNAQTDLTASFGLAVSAGRASVGVAGKIFSSQLIETERATAYAVDVGWQAALSRRLSVGVAAQNFGTPLKFIREREPLPRLVRAGAVFFLGPSNYRTTLFLDAPYHLNEKELAPAVGIETAFGPLVMRGGYKFNEEAEEFTTGIGVLVGAGSIDYSIGLADGLETRHRASLSLRFGSPLMKKAGKPVPKIDFYEKLDRGGYR